MAKQPAISELVIAAQTGDGRSFAELVRIYQDIAVAYAIALLGDYPSPKTRRRRRSSKRIARCPGSAIRERSRRGFGESSSSIAIG